MEAGGLPAIVSELVVWLEILVLALAATGIFAGFFQFSARWNKSRVLRRILDTSEPTTRYCRFDPLPSSRASQTAETVLLICALGVLFWYPVYLRGRAGMEEAAASALFQKLEAAGYRLDFTSPGGQHFVGSNGATLRYLDNRPDDLPSAILLPLRDLRQTWTESFSRLDRERSTGSIQPGAFLTALLLGDRSALDPRVPVLFRDSGVLHVLALSGFHLGLLAAMAQPFRLAYRWLMERFKRARRIPPRALYRGVELSGAFVFGLALLAYCGVAVPGPGLYRAVLMVLFTTAAQTLKIPWKTLDSYWASMVVLLVIDPSFVEDWGFGLSYLALFGLVCAEPKIRALISRWSLPFLGAYFGSGIAALWGAVPYLNLVAGVPLVLNGILTGPFFAMLIVVWAVGGLLWLLFPVGFVGEALRFLADITEAALFRLRLLPPLELVPTVHIGSIVVWICLTILILLPYYWYRALAHDRLRFAPIPQVPPGEGGLLDEKTLRPKLHGRPSRPKPDRRASPAA